MVRKIQADYARLEAIGALFVREATQTSQLLDHVRRLVETLQNGDWTGVGAQAFYKEMDGLVAPAMKRLVTTLQDASGATKRILVALRDAEEQAGALFRGDGSGAFSGESGFDSGGGIGVSPRPGVPDYAPTAREQYAGGGLSDDFFDSKRQRFNMWRRGEVPNHRFVSGVADALKYEVIIQGQKVTVYAPKNPDPRQGHFSSVEQIARAISVLPEPVRMHINTVNLEPGPSPLDPHWKIVRNDPNFRTYMEAGPSGLISVFPSQYPVGQGFIDGSLIHESGHVVSKRMWGTDPARSAGWKEWATYAARDGNPVSGYGNQDIQEDFSESLIQWMVYKGTPYEDRARFLWGYRFNALDDLIR